MLRFRRRLTNYANQSKNLNKRRQILNFVLENFQVKSNSKKNKSSSTRKKLEG